MRRLVSTSAGPLLFEIVEFLNLQVVVRRFDERGWEAGELRWERGKGSLEDLLATLVAGDEARVLADELLTGYVDRGGEAEDKRVAHTGVRMISTVALVFVLLSAAVVVLSLVLVLR